MNKYFLCASAFGVVACVAPGLVHAQTQNAIEIEEVVVTAQRFEETAQKTPLIITAIPADDLQGVSDIRQLQTVTPGISLGPAGNVVQTFVRGVGSFNAQSSQESAIAYNADGVFLFQSTMISPLMYDLERVEILKGPQGTLYGRNASGGAVNLLTKGASLAGVEGYVEGELGNYEQRRLTGAVNLPLSETLAVRLAAQHTEHSGYMSDGTDDQDLTSGRVRVLWTPTQDITLRLGADASKVDAVGAGTTLNPNPTGIKRLGGFDPRAQTGSVFAGGLSLLSLPPNPPPHFDDDQWSAFAQLDINLGFANLTLLPAYRYEKINSTTYVPGYQYDEIGDLAQKSFEARLANQTDRLRWVVGAYYFKIDQKFAFDVRNESLVQHIFAYSPNEIESYAFFGETTFSVTDNLRLIGGLRYTHEENRKSGFQNFKFGPAVPNPFTGVLTPTTAAFNPFNPFTNPTGELLDTLIDESSEGDATTWKIGAEYDLSPDSMLFATVSRGFKGGGNYIDATDESRFGPEYLTAFELGSRNRFLGNSLQVNAELFYWKYKDQQVTYVGFNSVNAITLLTVNAGEAKMYGANLDVIWRATANDTFHVGVEYMKSEYDSFSRQEPSFNVLPNTACRLIGYDPTPGSGAPTTVDCQGKPLLRAPEWSGLVSYEHTFPLGGDRELVFDTNVTFASSQYLDPTYTPQIRQKSQALVNASLTYDARDLGVTVVGWVKNIGDELVYSGGGQFVPNYSRPTLLPPRTYGVSVRKTF